LTDVAHDLCDPTMKRGSLMVWDVVERVWRNINATGPLIASIYVYHIPHVVSLLKISLRTGRSVTSVSGNASTMASRVKQRDGQCWVTTGTHPITNSHVCPKRMGDHLLRVVYRTFVENPLPTLSIYDEMCGITLTPTLDALFDIYELGLWSVAPVRSSFFSSSIINYWFMNEPRMSTNATLFIRLTGHVKVYRQ
jgi:hypothetical protein